LRLLTLLLLVVLAILGGGYLWFENEIKDTGPSAQPTRVLIERGSGLASVARELEQERVITHARVFQVLAMLRGQESLVKAGEYLFPAGSSMVSVLGKLVKGDTVIRRVSFPEGMSSHAMLLQLAEAVGMTGTVPEELPEGTLMPATYDYGWGDERSAVLERMRIEMQQAVGEAWQNRASDLPLQSPQELITLASIVEKETGLPQERPKVAGVFLNRLKRGMKLQSDPTVIYAVTRGKGSLGRGLKRSELTVADPYNTYHSSGLPPGPIANPGRESLMAVAQPDETDALYFVADGSGGHVFSATLAEHNRNVARWRQIERDRKASQ
jgi:UPF0755 protein